ncbi:hypothetical protein NON08_02955 [Cetobacterium somerae]|uniref:hypothetical protein n=1 Tax=Cetobacterium sp. NK01 TaxID=2993530 RepID=UPI0021170716|nr:hypothetical protein [Cetobacterium sp. NK01]MCQ8211529.1 hypothetical protein [Cetobacterium sp. NK01]
MKKFILLFSLVTFVGCSQFSSRKDQSQNIVFNSSIPQGKYTFTLVSLDYPQSYNKKIDFYKNLNKTLSELTVVQKNNLNLLITQNMYIDFTSLLNTGWFDKEILGMKVVEDLNENDIDYLNTLNVSTPTNAGDLQQFLNKQYYLLLKLTDNENMYNPEFLYTELDKSILMENTLLDRKSLIDNIKSIQKNFVYDSNINIKNVPIYLNSNFSNIDKFSTNPIIFENSNTTSGFKAFSKSLVIFIGDNNKIYSNKDYEFISTISSPLSLDNLKDISRNSTGVSKIINWKRKDWKKITNNETLENKFSTWEDK